MIEILTELKRKHFFPQEEWEPRGLIPSPEEAIEKMETAVNNFVDFLIQLYQSQSTQEQTNQGIQGYFDEWDCYDFDTEEREFIYDKYFDILREIKIEPKHFVV